MKQIYPCLWFNQQAKEAAEFYCAAFGAEITGENHFVFKFEAAGQKLYKQVDTTKKTLYEADTFLQSLGYLKEKPSVKIE